LYFTEPLSVSSVFRNAPSTVLSSIHEANNNPLGFANGAYAYELLPASTNASRM
jgi:hypothetical protein